MGQFVASMRREMDVPEQVEAYLASQPGPKQADLRRLHAHILAEFPGCRLWFTDGTNADGKVVANPNIGYGACTITYADGSSIALTSAAPSDNASGQSNGQSGGGNVANNNLLERLIQMQAQLLTPSATQNIATV